MKNSRNYTTLIFDADHTLIDYSADATKNETPYQMLDVQGNVSTNYEAYDAYQLVPSPSYDELYPKLFTSYSGYKVNEKGTIVYNVPITNSSGVKYNVRYLLLSAITPSNVELAEKPVAKIIRNGTTLAELTLEYGKTRSTLGRDVLEDFEFSLFYVPNYGGFVLNDSIRVEVSLPENACIKLDVVRSYYSAWYGYNNNHTYGGTGTYVGTDGISADKMQVNGNDVWSKGEFTLPLPIEQGGTGATEAIEALNNLHGISVKTANVTSSSSAVLSFSGAVRFVVLTLGASTARHGVATVYCQGASSTTYVVPVGTLGSAITLTPGTGSLTISATASIACYIVCLNSYTYDRITITNT